MKKILMIAVMMTAALTARAQMEEGTFSFMPKVGYNHADISGGKDFVDNKGGVAAGFELEYKVASWFGISAGAMYEQEGWKYKEGSEKQENEYINVPVMAKFYVWKGLSFNTGLQAGFLTKAKGAFEKEDLNKFDFSIPFSISYEFPFGLNLDLRFIEGVSDVVKNQPRWMKNESPAWLTKWQGYEDKNKNRILQFTIGYKFAL